VTDEGRTDPRPGQDTALERQARRLAMVVNLTSNAVLITDADERIEWVNESFTRMSGYTLAEVVGLRPGPLLHGPDTDPATLVRIEEALRETGGYSDTLLNYRKDGTPYWVAVDAHAIHDEGDKITGYVAVQRDVTREAEQRQALAAERDFARAVMETVAQGLTVTGPDLRFAYVNPAYAAMTGYRPEELIGLLPSDVTLPAPGVDLEAVRADRRAGKTTSYRARLRRSDGGELEVLITGVPVMRDGRQMGSISVVTDITSEVARQRSLERAHASAMRAHKSRNAFLGRISHELRAPLNTIIGYAEILVEDLPAGSARRPAERIARAARSMLHQIDDVLELSRSEGGFYEVRLAVASLASVTTSVLEAMHGRYDLGAVTVEAQVEPVPRLLLDPQRTHQVLTNLVANAIKYGAGERGRVDLRASVRGDAVMFEVEDQGPGLPPEMHTRLFESYIRSDAAEVKGFGIGLPLSRQLARVMGGDVTLSPAPGGGTRATLTLPLVAAGEGGAPPFDSVLVVGGYERVAQITGALARSGLTQRWFVAEERASAEQLLAHGRAAAVIWHDPSSSSETIEPFDPIAWAAALEVPPTIVVESDVGAAPALGSGLPGPSATRVVRSSPETLTDALRALRRATSSAGGDHG
jgi:PAS domain S-box-containing protein